MTNIEKGTALRIYCSVLGPMIMVTTLIASGFIGIGLIIESLFLSIIYKLDVLKQFYLLPSYSKFCLISAYATFAFSIYVYFFELGTNFAINIMILNVFLSLSWIPAGWQIYSKESASVEIP